MSRYQEDPLAGVYLLQDADSVQLNHSEVQAPPYGDRKGDSRAEHRVLQQGEQGVSEERDTAEPGFPIRPPSYISRDNVGRFLCRDDYPTPRHVSQVWPEYEGAMRPERTQEGLDDQGHDILGDEWYREVLESDQGVEVRPLHVREQLHDGVQRGGQRRLRGIRILEIPDGEILLVASNRYVSDDGEYQRRFAQLEAQIDCLYKQRRSVHVHWGSGVSQEIRDPAVRD